MKKKSFLHFFLKTQWWHGIFEDTKFHRGRWDMWPFCWKWKYVVNQKYYSTLSSQLHIDYRMVQLQLTSHIPSYKTMENLEVTPSQCYPSYVFKVLPQPSAGLWYSQHQSADQLVSTWKTFVSSDQQTKFCQCQSLLGNETTSRRQTIPQVSLNFLYRISFEWEDVGDTRYSNILH